MIHPLKAAQFLQLKEIRKYCEIEGSRLTEAQKVHIEQVCLESHIIDAFELLDTYLIKNGHCKAPKDGL